MANQQTFLNAAVAAARQSGKVFQKYFGRPTSVKNKNNDPRDLVTEVDRRIEKLIRMRLKKKFPGHKIIGEEFSKDAVGKTDMVWIIDPIDGTTNYIQGLPICCISLALWDKRGPLVAVLYNPILKQMYSAARNRGARLNGKIIRATKKKNLDGAFGGIGWLKVEKGLKLFNLIAKHCRKLRVLASSAWQIGLVGSGNYDFQISYDINVWDFGAGALIAQEAGGKITDWQGRPITLQTRSIVASNGKIHGQLIKILKKL